MEATEFMTATARHARPKSEPAPPREAPPREAPRGKPARGKHGKPSLARRIAIGVVVISLIATVGPALIGIGIFCGIAWAWLSRGLTKS
jgi:hypothetical protein